MERGPFTRFFKIIHGVHQYESWIEVCKSLTVSPNFHPWKNKKSQDRWASASPYTHAWSCMHAHTQTHSETHTINPPGI